MSSATSIKQGEKGSRGFRLQAEDHPDAGFRPWHFFLLASLMTATVAVVLAKQATPEHLILLSVVIASAGFAAAAFYRTLAPLAADDASTFNEPLSERARAAVEREKALVLRSIKELEFDRAMGKIAPKDFDEMASRLRARAIALMKQLDQGTSAGYRELIERELQARLARTAKGARGSARSPVPGSAASGSRPSTGSPEPAAGACGACGTVNDTDATFCKRCGTKLQEAAGAR
jgi:hypothetical protein